MSDWSKLDVHIGEKGQHGIKYLVAQFPDGMTSLSGPFKGKTHDCAMLTDNVWAKSLAALAEGFAPWRFSLMFW